MKILKSLAFLFLLLAFPVQSIAQELKTDNWKTFRNKEHEFRFIYPDDWIVKQGRGPNVKANIANPITGANCNVVVRTDKLLSALDDSFYLDLTDSEIAEMTPDGFSFLEGGKTHVDNKSAIYIYMQGEYKTLEYNIFIKNISVHTLFKGKMYVITCGSSQKNFEQNSPIIKRIISSFVFENYNIEQNKKDISEEPIAGTEDDGALNSFWLTLFLSLIITWSIGLLPPLLARYVFLKKSMGRMGAIIFCFVFFIINTIIFIVLSDGGKTHSAPVLITLISYWILRKDIPYRKTEKSGSDENDPPS